MQMTLINLGRLILIGSITLAVTGTASAQLPKSPWSKPAAENFKDLAKGKDHIVINDMPEWLKYGLNKFAKDHNITNGKLTLAEYSQFHEKMQNLGKIPPAAGGETPAGPPVSKHEGTTVGGDKVHNADLKAGFEYTIRLKAKEPGWDPYLYLYDPKGILITENDDGDGFPNSKIVYTPTADGKYKLKCSSAGGNSSGKYELIIEGGPAPAAPKPVEQPKAPEAPKGPPSESKAEIDLEELEQRPNVYTGPKLPPGLPDWFAKLDTDRDGQIGLYEWVAAKKSIEEFKAMDRNGDGFLTPEEVLYFIASETNPEAVASGSANSKKPPDNSKKPGQGKFGGMPIFPKAPGK